MKYKIIGDVNISGNVEGDVFEAEPHAVAVYLEKGEVVEVKATPKKKTVKRAVKK